MEDDLNFKVNGGQPQFLAPASPEHGTAQPQLVTLLLLIWAPYYRFCNMFDKVHHRLELWTFVFDCINWV